MELEAHWTGESGERRSLRDLADLFNQRLLEAAIRRVDSRPLDGEVENLYALLTDDDRSPGDRVETETRLGRIGVDVESLRSDFVSHQSVHNYLRKHREVEYEHGTQSVDDRLQRADDSLRQLKGRTDAVTRSTFQNLGRSDALVLGDIEVTTDILVYCADCDRQFQVGELLERGGCDCNVKS